MAASDFLFYDGQLVRSDKVGIAPDNRSFRYGDGCFETIRVVNNQIVLAKYHMERMFATLDQLKFVLPKYFTSEWLQQQIEEVVRKNQHQRLARVRVTIFRGSGGVYDPENHFPHHLIQSWALNPATQSFNENGLVMDIFTDARKVCDRYSPLKTNNYLCYLMGALWAKEKQFNDVLLLNPYDQIADSTIANVFIVKDGIIQTPALSEGPVNGVMRRHLLQSLRTANIPVVETSISPASLLEASEVFLTNAIHGIKWVRQVGKSEYDHSLSNVLYRKFIRTLVD